MHGTIRGRDSYLFNILPMADLWGRQDRQVLYATPTTTPIPLSKILVMEVLKYSGKSQIRQILKKFLDPPRVAMRHGGN